MINLGLGMDPMRAVGYYFLVSSHRYLMLAGNNVWRQLMKFSNSSQTYMAGKLTGKPARVTSYGKFQCVGFGTEQQQYVTIS